MDYKQILDDIIELDERITVIRGFGDVIIDPSKARTLGYLPDEMIFKDFKSDNYWVIMGRGTDELIVETMSDVVCEVDIEGEYEFKAVLKWIPAYERLFRIEHIEFNFIQTFQQRERQSKLDEILNSDLDLFN